MTTQEKIAQVSQSHGLMVIEKNKRYGDSALSPIVIFTNHLDQDATCNSILVRLDDKLSRVKNSDILNKNDVSDIMGYLTLLCVDRGWLDFDDQID